MAWYSNGQQKTNLEMQDHPQGQPDLDMYNMGQNQALAPDSIARRGQTEFGTGIQNEGIGFLNRPKIQGDMSAADARVAGDISAARDQQTQAHGLFANAAAGNGPNVAQKRLNMGLDSMMNQQAGAAPGLATLAAARQGSAMGNQAVGQAAQGRQGEQMQFLSGMADSTKQRQTDELQLMNMGMSRAEAQAKLDLQSQSQNVDMFNNKIGLADQYNKLAQDKAMRAYLLRTGQADKYKDLQATQAGAARANVANALDFGATWASVLGKGA
jgi:hypothetical protein